MTILVVHDRSRSSKLAKDGVVYSIQNAIFKMAGKTDLFQKDHESSSVGQVWRARQGIPSDRSMDCFYSPGLQVFGLHNTTPLASQSSQCYVMYRCTRKHPHFAAADWLVLEFLAWNPCT